MPRHLWVSLSLTCSCALIGCAGSAEPGPVPGPSPSAPAVPGDGALLDDVTVTPDSGPGIDIGVPVDDGAACPMIPPGKYKGALAGGATGTIVFKIVAGPSVGAGTFKITQPKEQTYPLVLGGLDCDQLHAAIARPEGSTGGTDLRGSIAARFKASQVFAGTWTMPFSSGTFKAKLQP